MSEGGYKFSQDYLYNQQRGEVTTQRQVTHLVMTHLWRKDAKGNIEVRDAFWRPPKGKALEPTVPPLLVYADLLTTNDPRAHAVAREIYDQYLQHDPKAVT